MPLPTPSIFVDDINQSTRDKVTAKLDALGLLIPGAKLAEPKLIDNVINLSAGSFPFFRPVKDSTSIIANNAVIAGMTANNKLAVTGARFSETVTVEATGNVMFVNCRFDKQVAIVSGGRASFTNCHFTVNVNNAGAVGNVGVIGCYRAGAAHTNCTVLFETT